MGLPAVQMPVVAIPFPEIVIFKWVPNRGRAEVQVHAYEARSGEFRAALPAGVGRAKFDEFTVLVLVGFTVSDLDERPAAPSPATAAGRGH